MKSLKPPNFLTITVFLILIITISTSHAQQVNEQFKQCSSSYDCGNITNIPYPFWGDGRPQDCGLQGFELICPNDQAQYPRININSQEFQVLEIQENVSLMRIVRTDMFNFCDYTSLTNTTLDHNFFDYVNVSDYMVNLLFDCSPDSALSRSAFQCGGQQRANYFIEEEMLKNLSAAPTCTKAVKVPMLKTEFVKAVSRLVLLQDAVNEGFYVQYNQQYKDDCSKCKGTDGICGSSRNGRQFSCLCQDGPHSRVCQNTSVAPPPSTPKSHKKLKMIIVGISAGIGGILIFSILLFLIIFLKKRRKKKYTSFLSSRDISSELCKPGPKEESYKGHQIFSYDALEKATNY